jgi:hypothetical protein
VSASVAAKRRNDGRQLPAEVVKGKGLTKGEAAPVRTLSRYAASTRIMAALLR